MKITFVVPHFPPHVGGGEQLYLDVCKGLEQKGHSIRVVTSNSGGITGHQDYLGLDVYYYPWKQMFGHPMLQRKDLIEHIRWCDVVHTAIYSPVLKTVAASRKEGKPCVVTLHEVMGDKWSFFEKNPLKAAAFRLYESLILGAASNVHVVSKATQRDYLKYCKNPRNVFMIYNFLNLPDEKEICQSNMTFKKCFELSDKETGILYFGRPASNKGIFVLLEAIKIAADKAREKSLRFCFLLSQNPAQGRKEFHSFITAYHLDDIVRIHDSLPRTDQLKVLSEADLVVVPSITEGFGYAACEACFLGRPVISSDAGSLREVVSGQATFFENMNAKELSKKLLDYMENGTANFAKIPQKTFDKDEIIDSYISMYESLIRQGGH